MIYFKKTNRMTGCFLAILSCLCILKAGAQNEQIKLTRSNFFHQAGFTGGDSMIVNIFDGSKVAYPNAQFPGKDKVTYFGLWSQLMANVYKDHALQMATIAAGNNPMEPGLRGVCPNCNIRSAYLKDDVANVSYMAWPPPLTDLKKILVSNHSYGPAGADKSPATNEKLFGAYTLDAADMDDLAYKQVYWLPVVAAGNEGQVVNTSPRVNIAPTVNIALVPEPFDKLSGPLGTAKNSLEVGALASANINAATGELLTAYIANYSSGGPTDDLRIKPEVVAPGEVYLPTVDGNPGFTKGTSNAAAAVSGMAALIQQYWVTRHKRYMRAATLKGLIIHTADRIKKSGLSSSTPADTYPAALVNTTAPNLISGYGMVNAKAAKEAIDGREQTSFIEEYLLDNGTIHSIELPTAGPNEVKVSISWTDPVGDLAGLSRGTPTETNATTTRLVNDLDVLVIERVRRTGVPTGQIFEPYKVNFFRTLSLVPFASIYTGNNSVDPYEQIQFQANPDCTYTAVVSHKGSLKNNNQNYSLIVTGLLNLHDNIGTAVCANAITINQPVKNGIDISAANSLVINAVIGANPANDYGMSSTFTSKTVKMINNARLVEGLKGDIRLLNGACFGSVSGLVRTAAKSNTEEIVDSLRTENAVSLQDQSPGLYPNPTKDILTVSGTVDAASITVSSSGGQLLGTYPGDGQANKRISLQGYTPGVYFISITRKNGSRSVVKVIKY